MVKYASIHGELLSDQARGRGFHICFYLAVLSALQD